MSPKEQAEDLIKKFECGIIGGDNVIHYVDRHGCKSLALTCVGVLTRHSDYVGEFYWNEVKQEIEKL